jgi:hypothetical protein
MARLRIFAIAAALAAFAVPAYPMQPNAMQNANTMDSTKGLKVNMGDLNGSKQTGSATIKDVAGGVEVTVTLSNEPTGASQPAHIHKGTCGKLDPAPYKPLADVVGGTSTTTVSGITVADLKNGKYAINVHESASNLTKYVSCGDI